MQATADAITALLLETARMLDLSLTPAPAWSSGGRLTVRFAVSSMTSLELECHRTLAHDLAARVFRKPVERVAFEDAHAVLAELARALAPRVALAELDRVDGGDGARLELWFTAESGALVARLLTTTDV